MIKAFFPRVGRSDISEWNRVQNATARHISEQIPVFHESTTYILTKKPWEVQKCF